ncbi:hypothetical protein IAU59_002003 [Kwoniella sp. CBS 9459]
MSDPSRSSFSPTFTSSPSGSLAGIPGMTPSVRRGATEQPTVLPDTFRQSRTMIGELKGLSGVDASVVPRPNSSVPTTVTAGGRTLTLDQYRAVARNPYATPQSAATQMTEFLVQTQSKENSLSQASQNPHGHRPLFAQSLSGNSHIRPVDPSWSPYGRGVQPTAALWHKGLDVESQCAVAASQALVGHMASDVKSALSAWTYAKLQEKGIDQSTATVMTHTMVPP